MEISSILRHQMAPCVVLGLIFGFAGHYFETKPHVIALGIIAMFTVSMMSGSQEDKMLVSDLSNLRDENESLKQNLMQVYSMVKQNEPMTPMMQAGPPPPIPPSMTGIPSSKNEEEEDDAKPYL